MRYLALASDYDGTLAHDGIVDENTLAALQRFRQSGRKLILVTGRELPDLERVFPHFDLFDLLVAENGALLFNPGTREKRTLAQPPPKAFVAELTARGVSGLSVGDVIVATWHPHETTVLDAIRRLGLDLQVIFNKDAVMVLPAGVNKMTGLNQALAELGISRHNVAAIGDAENDHAFLKCCECSCAVSNALQSLKENVDIVTAADHGAGVVELIDRILDDDLSSLHLNPATRGIRFGQADGRDIFIDAEGQSVLLCGQSGGGKSTFVAGLVETLIAREYQVCIVDPEGDYEDMAGFVTLGDEHAAPVMEQIFQLLESPASNLIVNLIGIKMHDRPGFFASLLARLQEKRLRHGRPHWLVIDEAHHLLPSEWAQASVEIAGQSASTLMVTVHPEHVSKAALRLVNVVAVTGKHPRESIEEFANAVGIAAPETASYDLEAGQATVWFLKDNKVIERMQSIPGHAERKRHRRKYAEGELESERVFYFRGPESKMNLRAHNLSIFLQMAAGVDDETWLFHLERGDYSKWLSGALKDPDLGKAVESVEQNKSLTPSETRREITKAIEAKYTCPA